MSPRAPHLTSSAVKQACWYGLLISIGLFVLGCRWALIGRFGTVLPVWDQWDAEGLHALLPWFTGGHLLREIFTSHNEHYPVLTKVLNLLITVANGTWDQRLECTVNAVLPATLAIVTVQWMRQIVPPRYVLPLAIGTAFTWALPLSWENLIRGFHSQQFFLILCAMGAIVWLPFAPAWTGRWLAGTGCALLGLISMGSGLVAAAVVLALIGLRLARREIRVGNVRPTVLIALLVCAAGWLTRPEAPYHEPLRAHSLAEWFVTAVRALQWPAPGTEWLALVVWFPSVLLALRIARSTESARTANVYALLGLATWVFLQIMATAYARGAGGPAPASRYVDTLVFGCVINLLALGWMVSAFPLSVVFRRALLATAVAWATVVGWGFAVTTRDAVTDYLPSSHVSQVNAIRQTRAFLETGDRDLLKHPDIPYPGGDAYADRLSHPELVRLLPAKVRPQLADTSERANRAVVSPPEEPLLSGLAAWLCHHGTAIAGFAFATGGLCAAGLRRANARSAPSAPQLSA